MFRDLLALLEREIDGKRSLEYAAAIHSIDRHFAFSSFRESARLSADLLRGAGLTDVEILEAPADGRTLFGDWMMPFAWEAEEATFDIIAESGVAERVADRSQVPACLAMWSAPTPPEGLEGDIIRIENPVDRDTWSPDAVRGNIVFTSAHPHSVKAALLQAGAVGILSDFQSPEADLPDAVAWINAWSDDPGGWALTKRDSLGWSFQISPLRGEKLRGRLNAGEKLRGRAVVRTGLCEGTLPVVTGVIPGAGKEEVLLIGHQFEQGALDNASGVAVMLEAARSLRSLIDQGSIAAPRRTIRLLFISECYTTMFWAEQRREARRTVAGICLDSPSGVPSLAIRPPEVVVNPHSQMSFADALVLAIAGQVMSTAPVYAWREAPYSMTDNIVADRTIDIPCPWIGGHSRTWHTSADTIEVVDPGLQELTARIAASYAYLIATADHGLVRDFAHLAAARGKAALSAAGIAELERPGGVEVDDSWRQIEYAAERHAEAVASVLKLLPPSERAKLRPDITALRRDVRRAGKDEAASLARRAGRPGYAPGAPELQCELAKIQPRRLVAGPITFDRIQPEAREGKPSPRWSVELFALLNWCDGRRSLAEASALAARELRRDRALSPDEFARRIDPSAGSMLAYFEFLRQHNYVTW